MTRAQGGDWEIDSIVIKLIESIKILRIYIGIFMNFSRFFSIFFMTIFFVFMIPVYQEIKEYILLGFGVGAITGMLFFSEQDESTIDNKPKGGKIAK